MLMKFRQPAFEDRMTTRVQEAGVPTCLHGAVYLELMTASATFSGLLGVVLGYKYGR